MQARYTGAMAERTNIHGRKPGRGVRPWLLIPKVLAVAVGFGGTAAAILMFASMPADHRAIVTQALAIGRVLDWLVMPAAVAAALLGALLVIVHGTVLLRMRWMQVKLVVVFVALPALTRAGSGQAAWLVQADPAMNSAYPGAAVGLGLLAVSGGLVCWAVVIWLGRHKPRLGQSVATVYQQRELRKRGEA